MIHSSAAFQTAVEQDSRLFRARLLMAGTPIAGDIKNIKIYKGSCGSSEFSPGICFCHYIEATVDNMAVAVEGVELQLQIGIMIGGDYSDPELEYITAGYFTAGKPETSVYRSTFTAQGRIAAKMSGAFVPPEVLTVAAVATKLQADTGVNILFESGIDTSVPIAGPVNNMTCREALAVLAAVIGGYATETAEGNVRVCKFANAVTASYSADIMLTPPVFADYDVTITGVEVIAVEGMEDTEEISYRSGNPVNVVISNSYMTEAAFAQFATNMIGIQYRPGSVALSLGDPRLEPWDVLQITDVTGASFIVPCMNIVHTYDGGFATDIEAPALPDETQVPSQIDKAIKIAISAENEAARARTAAENAETAASEAKQQASAATAAANEAKQQAAAATTAANTAQQQAAAATTSANEAKQQAAAATTAANSAIQQAERADKYANSALDQLGIVQDVVGVLSWASEHGSFTKTADQELQNGKVYFTYDGTDYTPVVTPDASQLSNYYELTVDEAMQSYIMAHLAVTNRGLWVLPSGINTGSVTPASGETEADARARLGANYKVLLSNSGMIVYDGTGVEVASYGESIEFNSSRPQYIGGEDAYIIFYDADHDDIPDSIRIGGDNVFIGSNKKLSDVLTTIDAVDNLEIGGRNLFINTNVPDVSTSAKRPRLIGQTQDTSVTGSAYTVEHGIGIRSTASGQRPMIRFGANSGDARGMNGLVAGKTYTISFDCKWKVISNAATGVTTPMSVFLYDDRAETGVLIWRRLVDFAEATAGVEGSERCEGTFALPDNVTMCYLLISASSGNTSLYKTGDYFELQNLKLEEGNKATAWSPAPEDLEALSEEARNIAEDAVNASESLNEDIYGEPFYQYTVNGVTYDVWKAEDGNYYYDDGSGTDHEVDAASLDQDDDGYIVVRRGGIQDTVEKIAGSVLVDTVEPSVTIQARHTDDTNERTAAVKITDERVSFKKNGEEVAYIDSNEEEGVIDINNARIHVSLRIGQLEIFDHDGGIGVRRYD